MEAVRELFPQLRVEPVRCIGASILANFPPKLIGTHLPPRNTHNRKIRRKQSFLGQIVEGWNELALSQVARSAEDHHHTRIGRVSSFSLCIVSLERHRSCSPFVTLASGDACFTNAKMGSYLLFADKASA